MMESHLLIAVAGMAVGFTALTAFLVHLMR